MLPRLRRRNIHHASSRRQLPMPVAETSAPPSIPPKPLASSNSTIYALESALSHGDVACVLQNRRSPMSASSCPSPAFIKFSAILPASTAHFLSSMKLTPSALGPADILAPKISTPTCSNRQAHRRRRARCDLRLHAGSRRHDHRPPQPRRQRYRWHRRHACRQRTVPRCHARDADQGPYQGSL